MKFFFKKKYQLVILLFGVLVAIILFFSDYGIIKRISLEMKSIELEKEIVLQEQITDSMRIAVDRLKYDTTEIERIAREKYGMSKTNEDIYHIRKKSR